MTLWALIKKYSWGLWLCLGLTFTIRGLGTLHHWVQTDPNTTFNRLRALDRRVTALEARCRS